MERQPSASAARGNPLASVLARRRRRTSPGATWQSCSRTSRRRRIAPAVTSAGRQPRRDRIKLHRSKADVKRPADPAVTAPVVWAAMPWPSSDARPRADHRDVTTGSALTGRFLGARIGCCGRRAGGRDRPIERRQGCPRASSGSSCRSTLHRRRRLVPALTPASTTCARSSNHRDCARRRDLMERATRPTRQRASSFLAHDHEIRTPLTACCRCE